MVRFGTLSDWRCRHCLPALLLLQLVMTAACQPAPRAIDVEHAVRDHFEMLGYSVAGMTVGQMRRNPAAERVYMAPLTYVVELPSLVLDPAAGSGGSSAGTKGGRLSFAGVTVKLQALDPGGRDWVVSQVNGVSLP